MPGIERKKSEEFKQLVLEKYIWLSNGRINLLPSKQININDLVDIYTTFKAPKGKTLPWICQRKYTDFLK